MLDITGPHPGPAAILGSLSLILWTLIIVTSVKYVTIALRVDNGGEGGILALMALLRRMHGQQLPLIMFIGLCGAALVYGDAAITPAISVMSALEGLNIVAPHLQRYVLPATVVVLVAVFAVQKQGTARIGRLLGPVMLIWFVTIALLGLWGIVQHPAVLWALNPIVGLRYLFAGGGITTLLVVGGVFLCVTGAEALYADLGHFGRVPIRLAWSCLVFPALILNYAGQAAFVLAGAPTGGNIFVPPLPHAPAAAAGDTGDSCNRHRQPGGDHGRLLDDAPGDPAGLVAATTGHPDLGRGVWPDLPARGELAADGGGTRPLGWLRKLEQPRRCLWNRGVGDDAGNHRSPGSRHARDLDLAAFDLRHNIADRNLHFVHQFLHRGAALLPDQHHAADQRAEQ